MPSGVYEHNIVGERNGRWAGGKSTHPLYFVYYDIRGRTRNPKHKSYPDYGGRGINICDEWWNDFWQFVADVGERPEGKQPDGRSLYSIDRINNNGNYEPGNVRWATPHEQRKNQRYRSGYKRRVHDQVAS